MIMDCVAYMRFIQAGQWIHYRQYDSKNLLLQGMDKLDYDDRVTTLKTISARRRSRMKKEKYLRYCRKVALRDLGMIDDNKL
jgi:hypothetical protein